MVTIRDIEPKDNPFLAQIIRNALEEFGANHPGTVYYEASTDQLYEMFQTPGSRYFVAEQAGVILGGAGIFPTEGLPDDTIELVKMYLLPEARGKGLGKRLIALCLNAAQESGRRKVYLESMPELSQAVALYERLGFSHLQRPLGNTGHYGCAVWMEKTI
ncbi:MAG: GNAT family N-acetyltransferase [Saprospiraceae bacterium]|nr:GNAT family N-acetyltransferase [Saprospiraceae bacterium]